MKKEAAVKVLSVDEMLASNDVRYTTVDAFGGKVRIGSISAGDMMEFMTQNQGPGKKTAALRILLLSLVDADGKRIGSLELLEAFKRKQSRDINKVVAEILKLNGLSPEGIDIETPLKEAGTDAVKLTRLVDELRTLADGIEAAGTDAEKLARVPASARTRREHDDLNG